MTGKEETGFQAGPAAERGRQVREGGASPGSGAGGAAPGLLGRREHRRLRGASSAAAREGASTQRVAPAPAAARHEFMAQSRMQLCAAGYANRCKCASRRPGSVASCVKGWGDGRGIVRALRFPRRCSGRSVCGASFLARRSRPGTRTVSHEERGVPSLFQGPVHAPPPIPPKLWAEGRLLAPSP